MIRKIPRWLLSTLFLMTISLAEAQQATKIPRVGYLTAGGDANARGPEVDVFAQGLRDLGYVEEKNFVLEYRGAEGKQDRLPTLVAELVQTKVDVLVITSLPAIRLAREATKTIPIVIVTTVDPVETGLIDSLARPGGNIAGVTRFTRELSGKRLELLKEAFPAASRVGVL